MNTYKTEKGCSHFFDTFIYFVESPNSPPTPKEIYLGTTPPSGFEGILYNTEQLTIPSNLEKILNSIQANPGLELWDYSQVNIRILNEKNVCVKFIPLHSPTWYVEKLKMFRELYSRSSLHYDIGFNGSPSPRREAIITDLRNAGFSVLHTTAWGEERDRELSKCKILVNIHYSTDHLIFETARCEPWLQLGVPIISELSVENDSRCILTTYDGFVDTVARYFFNLQNKF
jgi:hypothetical protein